ncbi:hypothetical protein [Streptacidiphilus neutrinimicus]|uniref:hypothetical protein n=1 Tax=Streptacidiphilus neutrinimicus TaxID=105420 RepID=UPI00126A3382|nr:hypothetical protein [Streptacidiphilus neutrinimicus]
MAAIPGGVAGHWNAARHDEPHVGVREVLVSCTGSLKPVAVEDLVYQLAFYEPDETALMIF